ncbi:MAG: hypothetical protein R3D88_04200 [Alphaproteobacteria bacterium]|nr:hypothetical protein [Alphaproteobacteria bacterium]
MIDQRGSAIIWILIAVALFAALTYAFNSTSRTSMSFLTDSQAEAYANEIIAYGNEVKTAVKRVQLRSCDDDEVSFENNIIAGYTNPNAPTTNTCHVFESDGGGIRWNTPNSAAVSGGGNFAFAASNEIDGIGSTCAAANCSDLVLFVSGVNEQVCLNINNALGVINPAGALPTDTTFTQAPQFIGAYSYVTTIGDEAGGVNLSGQKAGCFRETSSGNNIYYTVLISQ